MCLWITVELHVHADCRAQQFEPLSHVRDCARRIVHSHTAGLDRIALRCKGSANHVGQVVTIDELAMPLRGAVAAS